MTDYAEKAANHTGVMVALYPSPDDAKHLALDPGSLFPEIEPAEQLHVTLGYYGKADELSPGDIDTLRAACKVTTENVSPPMVAVGGDTRFSSPPGEPDPYVLQMDSPVLHRIHEILCSYGGPSPRQDHGYMPHMTLAYLPKDMPLTIKSRERETITFDGLTLVVADVRTEFPFASREETTAPGPMAPEVAVMRTKLDGAAEVADRNSVPDRAVPRTEEDMEDLHEKAVWATAVVNDLPDSAFLFIQDGGTKDQDGKTTPRSNRHFPVRDADGKVDLPHLRNALARIPQSTAPGVDVEALQKRARALLEKETQTQKTGKRMAGGMLSTLSNAISSLTGLLSWAKYADEEGKENDEEDTMKDAADTVGTSFNVYKASDGSTRWLSYSSNGFKDREGEIVSTKALEDAVALADVTEDKGPLRLFHVKGADVGRCDFQAVEGRFLVESGTFDDTPMAQKAKEYFQHPEEPLGVSIGFVYPESQFDGGVYNRIRIIERSVCPLAAAANPWTSFQTSKGTQMDEAKKAWLSKMFGDDLATHLVSSAAGATKELEGSVAFKATEADLEIEKGLIEVKAVIDKMPDGPMKNALNAACDSTGTKELEEKTDDVVMEQDAPASADVPAPVMSGEVLAETLIAALQPFTENVEKTLEKVAEDFNALAERMAALEVSDDERMAAKAAPRGSGVFRATESSGNVLDGAKAKELLGVTDQPVNHVAPYIQDLLKGVAR